MDWKFCLTGVCSYYYFFFLHRWQWSRGASYLPMAWRWIGLGRSFTGQTQTPTGLRWPSFTTNTAKCSFGKTWTSREPLHLCHRKGRVVSLFVYFLLKLDFFCFSIFNIIVIIKKKRLSSPLNCVLTISVGSPYHKQPLKWKYNTCIDFPHVIPDWCSGQIGAKTPK